MRLNRFLFLLICVIGEGVFSNQIEFTADRYETNLKTKTTVIEGNVELKYQSKVLNADKVTVLAESGAVEGVGEVSFIDEDLKFTAERAKFNIKNRLGKFWNSSLKSEKGLYLEGIEIERKTLNKFEAKNAKLSLCVDCPQSWSVTGSFVSLELEGYAEVHHALLQIKDLPVMYLPLFIFPVKSIRQSGFLIPDAAYSQELGFGVTLPYFWALRDDADLTSRYAYQDKGGHSLEKHLRYKYSERSFIDWKARGTLPSDLENVPKARFGLLGSERFQITPNIVQRWNFEVASDPRYSKHYSSFFDSEKIPFLESTGGIDYQNDNWLFSLESSLFQDNVIRENAFFRDRVELMTLPHLQLSLADLSFYRGKILLSAEAQYLRLRRWELNPLSIGHLEDSYNNWIRTGDRSSILSTLSFPLSLGWINWTPSMNFRYDHYLFPNSPDFRDQAQRLRFRFSQKLSSELWRVYKVEDSSSIKAIKHSIYPIFEWSYSPRETRSRHVFFERGQSASDTSPKFDLYDPNSDAARFLKIGTFRDEQKLGSHHLVTYGLGTRVVSRRGVKKRKYREVLDFNIEQDFNLLSERFGNIRVNAKGAYNGLRLDSDLSIDPETGSTELYNEVAYSIAHYEVQGIQTVKSNVFKYAFGLSAKKLGPVSASAYLVFNGQEKKLEEQKYYLAYESPSKCWSFSLGFHHFPDAKISDFFPAFRLTFSEELSSEYRSSL